MVGRNNRILRGAAFPRQDRDAAASAFGHRGQQTALLRMLGRDLHSTYGPTADTGGLPANRAQTIYAYSNLEELLEDEVKNPLPGPGIQPRTERP
jgi:hypothetical protein